MQPMLAARLDWAKVQYPVYVSAKIDGFRCVVWDNKPMSRTWKQLPNRHLRDLITEPHLGLSLDCLDGELVVGDPTAPNVYNATMSGIMSQAGTPKITYLVFDMISAFPGRTYTQRLSTVLRREKYFPDWVKVLPQAWCKDREEVERIEAQCLEQGYEGVIVRSPTAPYKFGRSTAREGYLLKLKRFVDTEAIVVGYEEMTRNENPAFLDEQGHTKHSSHRANQVPAGMLGALVCLLPQGPVEWGQGGIPPGVMFNIGSGFDMQQRQELWKDRDNLVGKIVTFKSQPHGSLDAPRFPIFKGFRDPIDL